MVPPEQLALPLPNVEVSPHRVGIPRAKRIFVNRNLKMSGIDWIGFDMDYTLAVYDRRAMDALFIGVTVDRMRERGYPPAISEIEADPAFPIRGLVIDTKLGHVLKLDGYRIASKGYSGMEPLSRETLREAYASRRIRLGTPRYPIVDTLYGLAEASLYAALVDGFRKRGMQVDYARLFLDVRESADAAYRDGTITRKITANLDRFVRRDPLLAQTLHKLRSAGKRLFLLTNSPWSYTQAAMHHLLGDAMPEYPTWRHYFDVIIASACKPAFFRERRPLLERDSDASRRGDAALRAVGHVERGHVYEGGNLADLERMLGVMGDRILYVGDHIHGDILRSKKEASWRTALVLHELGAEIAAHEASADDLQRLGDLTSRRIQLEDELRLQQALFKDVSRQIEASAGEATAAPLEASRLHAKRVVERVRGAMREVDGEVELLETRIDQRFHPYWGSLLKEGTEVSSFGEQVQAYACVYTSSVSNFLNYSPIQFFRSPRELMPHEM